MGLYCLIQTGKLDFVFKYIPYRKYITEFCFFKKIQSTVIIIIFIWVVLYAVLCPVLHTFLHPPLFLCLSLIRVNFLFLVLKISPSSAQEDYTFLPSVMWVAAFPCELMILTYPVGIRLGMRFAWLWVRKIYSWFLSRGFLYHHVISLLCFSLCHEAEIRPAPFAGALDEGMHTPAVAGLQPTPEREISSCCRWDGLACYCSITL